MYGCCGVVNLVKGSGYARLQRCVFPQCGPYNISKSRDNGTDVLVPWCASADSSVRVLSGGGGARVGWFPSVFCMYCAVAPLLPLPPPPQRLVLLALAPLRARLLPVHVDICYAR